MSALDGAEVIRVDVDHLPGWDGRRLSGTVVAWAQGGVHVRVDDEGVGVYAPEEVSLLEGQPDRGELT